VIPLTFQYDPNELEVIESVIKPLEIPHTRIIDSFKNEKSTTYVMKFIDGINCENEPKAEYLYIAAEKIGELYNKHIKVISKHINLQPIDSLIDYIFGKYQNRTNFVNHGDIQFKNFIYNDDLHLIDWGGQIHPFSSDLQSLIAQADEVNADVEEIKKRYIKFSKTSSISDEDIVIGGIINGIEAIFSLLIFDCPIEWTKVSCNELQDLIQKINFH